jgi:hypothetical protein
MHKLRRSGSLLILLHSNQDELNFTATDPVCLMFLIHIRIPLPVFSIVPIYLGLDLVTFLFVMATWVLQFS